MDRRNCNFHWNGTCHRFSVLTIPLLDIYHYDSPTLFFGSYLNGSQHVGVGFREYFGCEGHILEDNIDQRSF